MNTIFGKKGNISGCKGSAGLLDDIRDMIRRTELVALRHDLHAHPELGYQETRTADIIARELERYGLEVHRGLAGTGVVGVLGSGSGMIGLRADMDALAMTELNDFPYRSIHEGRMHACGHDGHVAMLLGAARYLSENQGFSGRIAFIFQPAEEGGGGAQAMMDEGLFEKFPIGEIYGLHSWPGLPIGTLAVMPGALMAGSFCFEITVQGVGCHAAMPHQGIDSIMIAGQLLQALQTIISRNIDPCDAGVLSVTQIHAGDAINIIPDHAVIRGTVRAFKQEVLDMARQRLELLCHGTGVMHGVSVQIEFSRPYPPLINHEAETRLCQDAVCHMLGAGSLIKATPTMAGEDFAFMLNQKPGCYAWLGNGPATEGRALHNPHYDFDDAALPYGIAYWVEVARRASPASFRD